MNHPFTRSSKLHVWARDDQGIAVCQVAITLPPLATKAAISKTLLELPMSESPEIPEAKDPFEKRVAITIAIIAAILSFISNYGDDAKTDAILKNTEAGDQWAFYQAKSIKEHTDHNSASLASLLPVDAKRDEMINHLNDEAKRYGDEKKEIKTKAEELAKESQAASAVNNRCDRASLVLQLAIILSSVAILSRWRAIWYFGVAIGLGGAVFGATAFFL